MCRAPPARLGSGQGAALLPKEALGLCGLHDRVPRRRAAGPALLKEPLRPGRALLPPLWLRAAARSRLICRAGCAPCHGPGWLPRQAGALPVSRRRTVGAGGRAGFWYARPPSHARQHHLDGDLSAALRLSLAPKVQEWQAGGAPVNMHTLLGIVGTRPVRALTRQAKPDSLCGSRRSTERCGPCRASSRPGCSPRTAARSG